MLRRFKEHVKPKPIKENIKKQWINGKELDNRALIENLKNANKVPFNQYKFMNKIMEIIGQEDRLKKQLKAILS